MPFIVREMDDDEAVIAMVDANLQREKILPSEKAFSYKMKLEAIKHQGKRSDLTSVQNEQKSDARKKVADDSGESAAQVQRYIRLTNLVDGLLEMVDEKRIGFSQGVEASYLNRKEQKAVLAVLAEMNASPSVVQMARLRELSREGRCTKEAVYAVLKEEPSKPRKFVIRQERLAKYFPDNVADDVIERTIYGLLDEWKKTH